MVKVVLNFLLSLLLVPLFLSGNATQLFTNSTFLNPAAMQSTRENQLISGFFAFRTYDKFSGKILPNLTQLGGRGSVKTTNTPTFPYLLLTHRISERFVGGFDVTSPAQVYLKWPTNGFQSPASVTTIIRAYEITPKLSFKIKDNLALGVGLRYLDFYNVQLANTLAGFYSDNYAGGVGFGGSAGLWYMINNNTFLDISYFLPVNATFRGTSTAANAVNTKFKVDSFKYQPSTFIANFVHIFTPEVLVGAKVAYCCWNVCKQIVFRNVALLPVPLVVEVDWKNTWFASLETRYQPLEKFALTVSAGFDQSQARAANNIMALPIGDVFFAGIGGEYRFACTGWFRLNIGQGRSWWPRFNNPATFLPAPAQGSNKAVYSWADVSALVAF